MRCRQVCDRLTEYQLDLLEDRERAGVEAHLAECADCRAELVALQKLDGLLEPMEEAEAPANLWSGVKRRMEPRRAPLWQLWRQPARQAIAVAAAMLLVVAGLWLGLRGRPGDPEDYNLLASDYQEQHVVAQWSQPLADDAALGAIYAGLYDTGDVQ